MCREKVVAPPGEVIQTKRGKVSLMTRTARAIDCKINPPSIEADEVSLEDNSVVVSRGRSTGASRADSAKLLSQPDICDIVLKT